MICDLTIPVMMALPVAGAAGKGAAFFPWRESKAKLLRWRVVVEVTPRPPYDDEELSYRIERVISAFAAVDAVERVEDLMRGRFPTKEVMVVSCVPVEGGCS